MEGKTMPGLNEPTERDVSQEIAEAILPGRPEDARELAKLLESPSARILLPADNELAVQLVPVQTISRLFEAQSDAEIHRTGLLIALGALIGFLTNVVTATEFTWTIGSSVFVAACAAGILIFGALTVRHTRRVARLREGIRSADDESDH